MQDIFQELSSYSNSCCNAGIISQNRNVYTHNNSLHKALLRDDVHNNALYEKKDNFSQFSRLVNKANGLFRPFVLTNQSAFYAIRLFHVTISHGFPQNIDHLHDPCNYMLPILYIDLLDLFFIVIVKQRIFDHFYFIITD